MTGNLTLIIGGGAAGISAAISKARRGEPVLICEKMPQLGKKILATGNGRCNLLNENLTEACYNHAARKLVASVFACFGKDEILDFFGSLGLEVYSQEHRMFPITNQAASVLKVLNMELQRLSVPVEHNYVCSGISATKNGFAVSSRAGKRIECDKLIIATGGKTYPALGSDGSMYEVVRQLGHSLIEPVPSAVPLVVKDRLCHILQGQRITATARSVIEGRTGMEATGDLLFTKYGLSGTAILDVSEEISIALNRNHKEDVCVSVDMAPFMDRAGLAEELERRRGRGLPADEMLVGLLPNKVAVALKELFDKDIASAVQALKDTRFSVAGTRGWNEAEFTAGGIDVSEVRPGTLESELVKGIYFAGEIMDVNGERGGYNLAWAWASGLAAGRGLP